MKGRYDYKVECAARGHYRHAVVTGTDRDAAVNLKALKEDMSNARVRAHPECLPWSIQVRFVSDWIDG